MRALLLAVAAGLPAQTITIHNPTAWPWRGYVRAELPTSAPAAAGWTADHSSHYVAGDGQAADSGPIWVWADLPPWGSRSWPLAGYQAVRRPLAWLDDLGSLYAGQPLVAGRGITWTAPIVDGSGVELRGHVVLEPWLMATLHFRYEPGQPWAMAADLRVIAADPVHPQASYQLPYGVGLSWGDGQVWTGAGGGLFVLPSGLTVGHNAAMLMPCTLVWPRLYSRPDDAAVAQARHARQVWAAVVP